MAKKRDIAESNQSTSNPSNTGRSWFFGIGINQYLNFDDLNNAVKDVEDILTLLEDQYELDKSIVLLDEQATRENIIAQLDALADEVGPEDKLLIYYSGHGLLNKRGKGFWIPHDAKKGSTALHLSNANLKDKLEDIDSKHTLLISDSCFSGSLFIQGKMRVVTAADRLEQKKSRWAICSGRQDEKVYDGKPGENSPFAASVLSALKGNTKTKLHTSYLADRVMQMTTSRERQLPIFGRLFDIGDDGGQYVFCQKQKTLAWQQAWKTVQAFPEETLKEINKKILLIADYLEKNGQAGNVNEAEEYGELLEQKLDFFQSRDSLFRLRRFAKKDTPFKEEALKLIEALKKGYSLPKEEQLEDDVEAIEKKQPPIREKENKPAAKRPIPKKPQQLIVNNTFTDPRDGQVYKTVELNGQIWMSENLNFDVGEGCWFYDDDPKNGKKYGRLYTWEAAQKACPPGWRLPTDKEWRAMTKLYGGCDDYANDGGKAAYQALSKGGNSGFSALLGGERGSYTFSYLGRHGDYWSATKYNADYVWYYNFNSYKGKLDRHGNKKSHGFSCRCLKD